MWLVNYVGNLISTAEPFEPTCANENDLKMHISQITLLLHLDSGLALDKARARPTCILDIQRCPNRPENLSLTPPGSGS